LSECRQAKPEVISRPQPILRYPVPQVRTYLRKQLPRQLSQLPPQLSQLPPPTIISWSGARLRRQKFLRMRKLALRKARTNPSAVILRGHLCLTGLRRKGNRARQLRGM
jgi:hypothetical protein